MFVPPTFCVWGHEMAPGDDLCVRCNGPEAAAGAPAPDRAKGAKGPKKEK